MARKVISVKPVTELELQFEDGKSLCVVFDTEAFMNLSELDGGLTGFSSEKSLPEQCAKIIYAGAKSRNKNFTLEDSRALVSNMDIASITDVINEFSESVGMTKNGVQGELQKKLMEQFIQTIAK